MATEQTPPGTAANERSATTKAIVGFVNFADDRLGETTKVPSPYTARLWRLQLLSEDPSVVGVTRIAPRVLGSAVRGLPTDIDVGDDPDPVPQDPLVPAAARQSPGTTVPAMAPSPARHPLRSPLTRPVAVKAVRHHPVVAREGPQLAGPRPGKGPPPSACSPAAATRAAHPDRTMRTGTARRPGARTRRSPGRRRRCTLTSSW